jgi:hypothetical protein
MNLSAVRNAESSAKEWSTKYAVLARLPFHFTSIWNPGLKLHIPTRDLSSCSYELKIQGSGMVSTLGAFL